jgi:hypothetical protein
MSSFGRLSIPPPTILIDPRHPGNVGATDELVVHPRHILRLALRRRAFRLASRACLVVLPWCREQRLLTANHALRWEAESALLASLSGGFALGARLTAILLRFEKATMRTVPKESDASSAPTEESSPPDPKRRPLVRLGSVKRPSGLEVRHVLRPDRASVDQVPR